MPRLLDSNTRTDALIVAAVHVICREGLRGLTLRAVAEESRVSAASIVHHFGTRRRMDRVLARRFGHRWIDAIASSAQVRGVQAFMPVDDQDVEHIRVWLAWMELSRSDPELAANVAGVRAEQRRILDSLTSAGDGETGLDLMVAVVEGLMMAICAPGEPLSAERARAALERYLSITSAA